VDSGFVWRIILSFIAGSLVVTASTVAAETMGPRLGGIIGGIPSTVAVSLLFIGIVQSPLAAAQATDAIPLALGFNGLFILAYASLANRGRAISLGVGAFVWLTLTTIVVCLGVPRFQFSMVIFMILLVACWQIIGRIATPKERNDRPTRFTGGQIAARAVSGGIVVAACVYLGKALGVLFGGIASVFPVVTTTTLVVVHHARGSAFLQMYARPLLASSLINVMAYALAVRIFYPSLGLGVGTLVAYLISGATAYACHAFLRVAEL
jgi:hypothetical protein